MARTAHAVNHGQGLAARVLACSAAKLRLKHLDFKLDMQKRRRTRPLVGTGSKPRTAPTGATARSWKQCSDESGSVEIEVDGEAGAVLTRAFDVEAIANALDQLEAKSCAG